MDYAACAGASLAFIASFYAWPRERRFVCSGARSLRTTTADPHLYVDRDADATIRRRSLSFFLNCVVSGGYLYCATPAIVVSGGDGRRWLRLTGRAVASTFVLFSGPLVDKIAVRDFVVEESWLRCWRSYLLCPLGEEQFFRGVLFSLMRRRSSWTQINVAAVLFAVSHSHHIVAWACDEYIERSEGGAHGDGDGDGEAADAHLQGVCWRAAMGKLGFVYAFTGVFGVLSGYYYLHVCEGSIGAIAAVHALCNFLGPPEFVVLRSRAASPLAKLVSAAAYVGGVAGWAWILLH